MNTQTVAPPAAPWFRHRWPWLLMLGPAIVLVAGLYTAWLAASHPDALVAGDYYKKGKAINQDLRRERAAQALGLSLQLSYDSAEARLSGRVLGRAIPAGPLTLRLVHATQPDKDLHLLVMPAADGAFALPLAALERSRWLVMLEDGARTWRLGGNWNWPAERGARFTAGL